MREVHFRRSESQHFSSKPKTQEEEAGIGISASIAFANADSGAVQCAVIQWLLAGTAGMRDAVSLLPTFTIVTSCYVATPAVSS